MPNQPINENKNHLGNAAAWFPIINRAILLLLIALGTALIANQFSPAGIPFVGQWDRQQGVVHANPGSAVFNDRLEIDDIEVAKLIYDADKTLFVDARSETDYQAGHVEKAVSLSLQDFDAHIEDFINRYPPEQPIVIYCSGRTCEDSHHLAQLLLDMGYESVHIMIDGFQAWKEKGFPVE